MIIMLFLYYEKMFYFIFAKSNIKHKVDMMVGDGLLLLYNRDRIAIKYRLWLQITHEN